MKIDLGPHGKVLGTKRVNAQGQVSGFSDYAGMDVLVVLPGDRMPLVKRDTTDLWAEAETLVRTRMKQAFGEYQTLRKRFPTPEAATQAFLQRVPAKNAQEFLDKLEGWIRNLPVARPARFPRSKIRNRSRTRRR